MNVKRRTIQIGAEHQPVMWESEIVPVMLGNDYMCRVIVDTAGKRYALELILSQEEYERFQQQGGAARIKRISGIAIKEGKPETVYRRINGKRRKCRLGKAVAVDDENASPRHGYACAALLSGVGVLFPQVEIIELPEDTRRVYLDAMNKATADEVAQMKAFVESGNDKINEAVEGVRLFASPPSKLKWWENLWAKYKNTTWPQGMAENEKWRSIAHDVVHGAIIESKKPNPADRHSVYLSPKMLKNLIAKLAQGSLTDIEKWLGERLDFYVHREMRKAKSPAGKSQ